MSYHTYQTEGIILGKKDVGEADGIFSILTKEFGKIDAIAQGSRYLKSKLRYNLEIFFHSRIGLVRGKDFWRIIDAEEFNGWPDVRKNSEKLAATSAIADLFNRMVKGEEADIGLWNEIRNFFYSMEEIKEPDADKIKILELLTKLRILSRLGYVEERDKWLDMPLEKARSMAPLISSEINKALEESQL